jgi:hypothetical protein
MLTVRRGLAAALVLCAAACGSGEPCATMPEMNDLLAQAALVRVDVYDATQAQCTDGFVTAQAAPLLSRTFPGGSSLRLDISPGSRTIALTTFSDAEGKIPTGSACTTTDLSGGTGSCLSLTLAGIDGGGCTPDNDTCPAGQYCGTTLSCQAGCKGGSDCTDPTKSMCDPNRHQCVECLLNTDCTGGQICSPGGACTQTCDASTPCPGGKSCCTGVCVDTTSDPLNCNGCGMPCTGGNTLCCNGQCANPSTSLTHCGMCGHTCSTLNGTPTCSAGSCTWTCNTNFVHCGTGNTGCETADNNVMNCGGCGNVCTPTNASANMCMSATQCSYTCNTGFLDCKKIGANTDGCESSSNSIMTCGGCAPCDSMHSIGATCPSGVCMYSSCASGYEDCDMTPPNANGCESPIVTHMNGIPGETYVLSCTKLGTPGNAGTYTLAMANAAAKAWTQATDAGPTALMGCPANPGCVQRTSATQCTAWCYSKSVAGYMLQTAGTTCSCPTTGSSTWN